MKGSKFDNFMEIIGDAIGWLFIIWSAFTFYHIYRFGGVYYIEPNSAILRGELVLLGALVTVMVERTVRDFIRIYKGRR